MKHVYIAGPFRAKTPWLVACNVRNAEKIHLAACRLGLASFCPHTNTANFNGECDDRFWLAATLAQMRMIGERGGAVVVHGGWHISEGTRGELAAAEEIGMPIFSAQIDTDPAVLRNAPRIRWTADHGYRPTFDTLGDWINE